MANDIAGFGARVTLTASRTFPVGLGITQYADDADPIDIPSIQIRDKAMGLNGDLITWSKANPLNLTLNVIPTSDDDRNLQILLEANRVGRGKADARDIITLIISYPDNSTITFTQGKITDGMPGNSIASAGRLKTRAYAFTFENKIETPALPL